MIIGVGLLLLLIVMLALPGNNDENETIKQGRDSPATDTATEKIIEGRMIEKISWQIDDFYVPTKMPVFAIEIGDMSKTILRWKQNFEMTEEALNNDRNLILNNGDKETHLSIDKEKQIFSWGKNLLGKKLSNEGELSKDDFEEILKQELAQLTEKSSDLSIRIEGFEYQKVEGPRFVSSNIKDGDVVSIEAGWIIDTYPIRSDLGWPIEAFFSRQGQLLKLTVWQPNMKIVKKGDVEIMSLEEIKNKKIIDFRLIDTEGGAEYDRSFGTEEIESANITRAKAGYVLDGSGQLRPQIIVEGNSKLKSSPIKVVLVSEISKL